MCSADQSRQRWAVGGFVPTVLYVDALSVFAAVTATFIKTPTEKSLLSHIQYLRELLDRKVLRAMSWVGTRDMLSDGLTKGSVARDLLARLLDGYMSITHECKTWSSKDTIDTMRLQKHAMDSSTSCFHAAASCHYLSCSADALKLPCYRLFADADRSHLHFHCVYAAQLVGIGGDPSRPCQEGPPKPPRTVGRASFTTCSTSTTSAPSGDTWECSSERRAEYQGCRRRSGTPSMASPPARAAEAAGAAKAPPPPPPSQQQQQQQQPAQQQPPAPMSVDATAQGVGGSSPAEATQLSSHSSSQ